MAPKFWKNSTPQWNTDHSETQPWVSEENASTFLQNQHASSWAGINQSKPVSDTENNADLHAINHIGYPLSNTGLKAWDQILRQNWMPKSCWLHWIRYPNPFMELSLSETAAYRHVYTMQKIQCASFVFRLVPDLARGEWWQPMHRLINLLKGLYWTNTDILLPGPEPVWCLIDILTSSALFHGLLTPG